jgi:hypothetical protein
MRYYYSTIHKLQNKKEHLVAKNCPLEAHNDSIKIYTIICKFLWLPKGMRVRMSYDTLK